MVPLPSPSSPFPSLSLPVLLLPSIHDLQVEAIGSFKTDLCVPTRCVLLAQIPLSLRFLATLPPFLLLFHLSPHPGPPPSLHWNTSHHFLLFEIPFGLLRFATSAKLLLLPSSPLCLQLIPSSDVDVVVFGVTRFMGDAEPMFKLADALQKEGMSRELPKVISTAKVLPLSSFPQLLMHSSHSLQVPIVKFRDATSHLDVDVAFGVSAGLENSAVIAKLLEEHAHLRSLALILKHYLKQRGLNETWNGGLGSYALVIMITHYLQVYNKYAQITGLPSSNLLATLLIGFLDFYTRKFNYIHYAISVRQGGGILSKVQKGWFNPQQPHLLAIEDPHNPESDLGASVFRIDRIVLAFHELYAALMAPLLVPGHVSSPSPLGTVVWVSTLVHDVRQRVKEAASSGSPPSSLTASTASSPTESPDASEAASAIEPSTSSSARTSKKRFPEDDRGKSGFKRGRGLSRSGHPTYTRSLSPAPSSSSQEFPALSLSSSATTAARPALQANVLPRALPPGKSTIHTNKENAHAIPEVLQS